VSSPPDPNRAPDPLAVAEADDVLRQVGAGDRLHLVERAGRRTWTNAKPALADPVAVEAPVPEVAANEVTARAKALKPNVRVTIPSPTTLTPEEREAVDAGGGWPVRVAFPDVETFMRAFGGSEASPKREPSKARRMSAPPDPLTDDTYIDQGSGLVPKRVFLRLAHDGAFACSRVGRKVLARWGDVKTALSARGTPATPSQTPAEELDSLRRRMGLVEKGGR
jgi:hypothetical protein